MVARLRCPNGGAVDFSASTQEVGIPRALAAEVAGVTPHTVSMWALRGWVDPNGNRRYLTVVDVVNGQRLYRRGDVLDAEAHTKRTPHSSRHWSRAAA